jgi:hypothetical protein
MWEPQHLTTLWACTACYRDSFTFRRRLLFYTDPSSLSYSEMYSIKQPSVPCKCALKSTFPFFSSSCILSSSQIAYVWLAMLPCTELSVLVLRGLKFCCIASNLAIWCCHVSQWLRRRFGLVIGFIGYLHVVTTNNYNSIADNVNSSLSIHYDVRPDRLCGLVVRVPGYNPEVPGSITGATRFSEK